MSSHSEDDSEYDMYVDTKGLSADMKMFLSIPALCDVAFFLEDSKKPVLGVKAILAVRSRVFFRMLFGPSSPQTQTGAKTQSGKKLRFAKNLSSKSNLNMEESPHGTSSSALRQTKNKEPQMDRPRQTIIIPGFEAHVFAQFIEYIHTGCVTLQLRNVIGLMNAAVQYEVQELQGFCTKYIDSCINLDTVCSLLMHAEPYKQYHCTKEIARMILEFIDENGNDVLEQGSIALIPLHFLCSIFSRDTLKADEFTKFKAALVWSKEYSDSHRRSTLKDVFANFLEYIDFKKIPAAVLMQDVRPLGVCPEQTIMEALAHQATLTSEKVEKQPVKRVSRSTKATPFLIQGAWDPYSNKARLPLESIASSDEAVSEVDVERELSVVADDGSGSSSSGTEYYSCVEALPQPE